MDIENTKEVLNRLLTRNYDAEKGYQQVAEKVDHPELRSFCEVNAQERYRFGHQIKEIEKGHSIEPDKGSSLSGDAHRAWMEILDKLNSSSDEKIVTEAKRGEDMAIADYQEAVKAPALSPAEKEQLSNHLKALKTSREQLDKIEAELK